MRLTLELHLNRPFAWGDSDCSLCFDAVEAMTGFDPIADIRGYRSRLGALRKLHAAGFETVFDLVATVFPEIPPAHAQRGDLGYPEQVSDCLMSPAVIDGTNAYSKGPDGPVVFPRSQIVRAFAV